MTNNNAVIEFNRQAREAGAVEEYDTYAGWQARGFQVRRGAKSCAVLEGLILDGGAQTEIGLDAVGIHSELEWQEQSATLTTSLMRRYLDTLAHRQGLERNAMVLLYLLEKLPEPCSAETLSTLTGLGKDAVGTALNQLLFKGLVERSDTRIGFRAPQLREEFRQLDRDFDALRFEGLTPEQISAYRELEGRVSANILRRLQGENADTV